jgi:hypothetical protein
MCLARPLHILIDPAGFDFAAINGQCHGIWRTAVLESRNPSRLICVSTHPKPAFEQHIARNPIAYWGVERCRSIDHVRVYCRDQWRIERLAD